MLIAGLQKLSLIDYPGKTCAIVFTLGCNFNCFYCHNRELIFPSQFPKERLWKEKDVFSFLEKRKGRLDAVSITGGEPTLHSDLPDFIAQIKRLGFLVKLDSNGTNPHMLEDLIKRNLVDYVAMDIKAPLNWEDYQRIIRLNNKNIFENVLKSVALLRQGKVNFEFRTSFTKGLFSKEDIKKIVFDIKNDRTYYLQNFINPQDKLDEKEKKLYNKLQPLSKEEIEELCEVVKSLGQKCAIRN